MIRDRSRSDRVLGDGQWVCGAIYSMIFVDVLLIRRLVHTPAPWLSEWLSSLFHLALLFPISLPWHSLGYTIDDRQITTPGPKASKLEDDPTALNGTGWYPHH